MSAGALPLGPRRPVYVNFLAKSFQRQIAYKFEYFIGILNGLLFVFIFTSLWKAIYDHGGDAVAAAPFNRQQIVVYAVYAMLVRISMTMEDSRLGQKVRDGSIAMEMIKPVNIFAMTLADSLGETFFHWFTRVLPIFAVSVIAFDAPPPGGAASWLLGAAAWTLGYTILFCINFLVGMLAFWFLETFSFQLMKYGLFTLFSGGILPLDFFPDWLRPAVAWLPFPSTIYVPTAIFIGHIRGAAAWEAIGFQALSAAVLLAASAATWRAGRRHLVVQGG